MAKWKDIPESTVVINRWASYCNNCGFHCDPYEETHERNLGWDEKIRSQKGCGIKWTHVTSDYLDLKVYFNRPDLEYISRLDFNA